MRQSLRHHQYRLHRRRLPSVKSDAVMAHADGALERRVVALQSPDRADDVGGLAKKRPARSQEPKRAGGDDAAGFHRVTSRRATAYTRAAKSDGIARSSQRYGRDPSLAWSRLPSHGTSRSIAPP